MAAGEQKLVKHKRGECLELQADDMNALLDMAINTSISRGGRPSEYPADKRGLENFIQRTIDYFEYVQTVNSNAEDNKKLLVPDIESWCVYLGITRMTLCTYSHRGKEWGDCISYYKEIIASIKKQLLVTFRIPPVVGIFDFTNNHGYVNSNEFKLTGEVVTENTGKDKELETAINDMGLIWSEEKHEYIPMEG